MTTPLERLAECLPAERFAVVLTVSDDEPDHLSVITRSDPSRSLDVYVHRPEPLLRGPQYQAVTGGGCMDLADADAPFSAAELIAWTLAGI